MTPPKSQVLLTLDQARVLVALQRDRPHRIAWLAEHLSVEEPAAWTLVRGLSRLALVTYGGDMLWLTHAGELRVRQIAVGLREQARKRRRRSCTLDAAPRMEEYL